jgi:outer membrane protein TolC
MEAARDRVPLAWDGLEAAQQNHRINLAQFKSGTAIALEVLHASHRLAGAQLDLARSIIDYNLSQVKLLAATGVLQLDLLQRPHQGGS